MQSRLKPLATILAEGAPREGGLKRSLGKWQLTAMGIGAIIGTGIFVLTGVASAHRAGPALTISFVVAGIVSALAALCYAEVASKLPIAGSAYSYAYTTFGELIAWIIGWDLILEYGLGAATVSIGWSGYFVNLLQSVGLTLPQQWTHAPFGATPGIMNVPAFCIILIMTALLARGTKESGFVNAIIVVVKLAIVLFFLAVGVFHMDFANFHLPAGPTTGLGGYFPFGWTGVLGGAAFIFFAYIGFDAVSTTAEEAKDPGKDLPFGIIASLAVCTILYIAVVAVLNGMVPFNELGVPSPVAFAMIHAGLPWAAFIISLGAIAGLTTVLLVMMFGQSRIIFAMGRDKLLPPIFNSVHPRFHTPFFSTVFFGVLIAFVAAFTDIDTVGSLTNMGTLVAFILVSLALPQIRKRYPQLTSSFMVPGGPWLIPILSAIAALGLIGFLWIGPHLFGVPIAWLGFVVWMIIGFAVYYGYGKAHSTVGAADLATKKPPVN